MIILLAHNLYRQTGGESMVVQAEKEMLESHGHTIIPYIRSNHESGAARQILWSNKTIKDLHVLIRENRPDVAHFHNTFFAMSPSAYYACNQMALPVVQTLHNFRLICPGALLMRENKPCEECVGRKAALPGVIHACWRNSHFNSASVAGMLSLHHVLGTWKTQVNRYIALSDFSRSKFIQGGIPAEKISVKPNFIPDPTLKKKGIGKYALYVGRLSAEKGIATLLSAWKKLPDIPLKIIGDGPLNDFVLKKVKAEGLASVQVMGPLPHESIFMQMQGAKFTIIPSNIYENFPLVIVESFATGRPVIAPNFGNLAILIKDGKTGIHFEAGNAQDLAAKVSWLWQNPTEICRMGKNARLEYEQKYTPEKNYGQLIKIYNEVIQEKQIR